MNKSEELALNLRLYRAACFKWARNDDEKNEKLIHEIKNHILKTTDFTINPDREGFTNKLVMIKHAICALDSTYDKVLFKYIIELETDLLHSIYPNQEPFIEPLKQATSN